MLLSDGAGLRHSPKSSGDHRAVQLGPSIQSVQTGQPLRSVKLIVRQNQIEITLSTRKLCKISFALALLNGLDADQNESFVREIR
jgi:hypothetical protein